MKFSTHCLFVCVCNTPEYVEGSLTMAIYRVFSILLISLSFFTLPVIGQAQRVDYKTHKDRHVRVLVCLSMHLAPSEVYQAFIAGKDLRVGQSIECMNGPMRLGIKLERIKASLFNLEAKLYQGGDDNEGISRRFRSSIGSDLILDPETTQLFVGAELDAIIAWLDIEAEITNKEVISHPAAEGPIQALKCSLKK